MMLNLSKYLGDGVEAWFSDVSIDFMLPGSGKVFGGSQRQSLAQMGIDADQVVTIHQVHGADVLCVTADNCCCDAEHVPEADAMITDVTGLVLAVRTADCVPVFLYDPVKRCIGMVHAGWKSAEQEIVCHAVERMREAFGVCAGDIRAVFGPSIRSCCYQVSQDFCVIFPEDVVPRHGNWFLDLQAVNRRHLLTSGLKEENICDCEICTCCNAEYFSYRRQGEGAGRHVSLLRIRD